MRRLYTCLVSIVLLLSLHPANAQSRKLYGAINITAQDTLCYLLRMDRDTYVTDTIASFPNTGYYFFNWISGSTAVDAANGRIFWFSQKPGPLAQLHYAIQTYNLLTNQLTTSDTVSRTNITNLDYDLYNNRLLMLDQQYGRLLAYDLATHTFTNVCDMRTPDNGNEYRHSAYNPYNGQYLVMRHGNADTLLLYDTYANSMLQSRAFIANAVEPSDLFFNLKDEQFYGGNDHYVVRIDAALSLSGVGYLTDSPRARANVYHAFNSQDGELQFLYDEYPSTYPHPHYFTSMDVATGHRVVDTSCSQAVMVHYADILAVQKPALIHDGLKAPYAAAGYQWYKGDTAMTGATAQAYLPQETGYYKAALYYDDGHTDTTANRLFIKYNLSVGYIPGAGTEFGVYPNPMVTQSTINCPGNAAITFYNGTIINSYGQCVWKDSHVPAGRIIVSRKDMAPGVYFYTFENNLGRKYGGRLIVQ